MFGDKRKLNICLVGPLPPPYGGMSVQTAQLEKLLQNERIEVKAIPVNYPFPGRFNFIDNIKYFRAIVRLLFYILVLFRKLKGVDLIHILSNSYLSFFLYTAPAVFIGKAYRCKVIINYRGGLAQEFLEKYKRIVCRILKMADAIVVPSKFLMKVFKQYGFMPDIVPNIINLERFLKVRSQENPTNGSINLLVARNLEKIYNVSCAIRSFQHLQKTYPQIKLIIVGEGSEEPMLKCLVSDMGLDGISFIGRVDNQDLPEFYNNATIVLNPSDADNFPISLLEAFASGVPVVSTNVGGVPFLIKDGATGLLIKKDDDKGMAQCVLRLLGNNDLYRKLSENGQKEALKYSWEHVRPKLFTVYKRVIGEGRASL